MSVLKIDLDRRDVVLDALRAAGVREVSDMALAVAKDIVREHYPELKDYLFLRGALHLLDRVKPGAERLSRKAERIAATKRHAEAAREYAAQHKIRPSEVSLHRLRAYAAQYEDNQRKIAGYDKIVEALDTWVVGSTKLGDCTSTHLTAEAAKLHRGADSIRAQAAAYQKIAKKLKRGETVRSCADRAGVIDLLKALIGR